MSQTHLQTELFDIAEIEVRASTAAPCSSERGPEPEPTPPAAALAVQLCFTDELFAPLPPRSLGRAA